MSLQIGSCVGELVEKLLDSFKIAAAHFRYRNAARQSLEQFDAKRVFEHLHQPAHRIGGHIEFDAGGLEAAGSRSRLERAQRVERRQPTMIAPTHFC